MHIMRFDEFEPIFGEAIPDGSIESHPFLFHVHAPDPSHLQIHVTDFRSSTWETVRSIHQLEDMQDSIGVGGSLSEFVDYIIASLKSEDVKIVLEGETKSEGAAYARLVAQKSKGMPRISISLVKLADAAAIGAIANFSLNLFKSFKSMHNLLVKEQEGSYQLTKAVTAEKEKIEKIQNQLELYSKRPKTNISDEGNASSSMTSSHTLSGNGVQNSPDKVAARDKVTNRVVPAYRRARVRGVLLQDTEDEQSK